MVVSAPAAALPATAYDQQWRTLRDFVRYHPGARHRRRLCWRMIRDLHFSSYLDVGCGPGDFIDVIRAHRAATATYGADLSSEVIERNRSHYRNATFHSLDIERQAPKQIFERQFELVTCLEVLEHLDDRDAAFTHLSEAVSSGGHLLVSCPTGRMYETEHRFGHTSHPTVEELQRHATRTGLTVKQIAVWGWPIYTLLKWATNVNANWAMKNFASGDYDWKQKRISDLLYYVNFANMPSQLGCQIIALFQRT